METTLTKIIRVAILKAGLKHVLAHVPATKPSKEKRNLTENILYLISSQISTQPK